MDGLTDLDMAKAGARPAPTLDPRGGLTDAQMAGSSATPSPEPQRARAALNGLTFGLGPRVMAAGRYIGGEGWEEAKQDEYKKLDDYRRSDPLAATAWEVAGSLPTLALPGVGQIGNANRIRIAAQEATVAGRTLAGVGSVGAEVARGGAQLGGLQGALHTKDYTDVPGLLEDATKSGAIGYVGGRVLNKVVQGGVGVARAAQDALTSGSTARGAALQTLRNSVDEQGTNFAAAGRSFMPEPVRGLSPEGQRAILAAHSEAVAGGADDKVARDAAARAYASLQPSGPRNAPYGPTTIRNHVATTVEDYAAHNRVPLIAAEVLSGVDAPITGEMRSLTQSVMNAPGAGRTALSAETQARTAGAKDRTRDLIDETIAGNIPGGGRDYVGAMNNIHEASRWARTEAYTQARERARAFDIEPVLQRFRAQADENAGVPRDELNKAVDTMQEWFTRMSERLADLDPAARGIGDNQILLNSYRQARSGLSDQIGKLARAGDREAAAHLTQLKSGMDEVVSRRNPAWWRANNGTAETYRVNEAADLGRSTPTTEGAKVQQLKASMANEMTLPEREAARLGMARQFHDKLSGPDGADPSRIFMQGGTDQFEEGTRGLVSSLIGHARSDAHATETAASTAAGLTPRTINNRANNARDAIPPVEDFYHQMGREQIARSTANLDKGSQTSALQQSMDGRNTLVKAAMALMHHANPIAALSSLTELLATRASRQRDAELGRMLATSTRHPHELLRLLGELSRTTPAQTNPFRPIVSENAAIVAPYATTATVADWRGRNTPTPSPHFNTGAR